MIPNVADILKQKLSEIQSRLPVKLNGLPENIPFEQYLSDAASSSAATDGTATGNTATGNSTRSASAITSSSVSSFPSVHLSNLNALNKATQRAQIDQCVSDSSVKYHVDADLIRAVIRQESNYDPYAVSRAGAQGLMQLMPETADALHVESPWDIGQNIDGGTRYLKDQLVSFDGNLELALAAYNAGPGSISKFGGIPPYAETQGYVKKVLQYYAEYQNIK